MKRATANAVFGFCALFLGCADDLTHSVPSASKATRELLLARGFKQTSAAPDIYELETEHLRDVLRDFGLSLPELAPAWQGPLSSDMREVTLEGLYLRVESAVRDKKGRIVDRSLDNPDALCKVRVWPLEGPPGKYLRPERLARMRIKSVAMPQDRLKPLQVTFELAADGEQPVLVSHRRFAVHLTAQGRSPESVPRIDVSFAQGTPEPVAVSPGKPVVLTLSVSDAMSNPITNGPWSKLPAGQYDLRVVIGTVELGGPTRGYYWEGVRFSDEYKVVIK
jgi:hypothetical protein